MVLYECAHCNFSSKLKNNYFRHLKTKKHLKRTDDSTPQPLSQESCKKNIPNIPLNIPISPPKNPTDFDFKSYMRRKGISRKLLLISQVFVPLQSKWSLKSWAFVERWKKTCKAKGVRFHATATQGAYPLN